MRVAPTVFVEPRSLGRALAALIADGIAAAPGGRFLLGCPSGRSPASTYAALAEEVPRRRLDLRGLIIVMMDEYVERDETAGAMRAVDRHAPHSCARFGRIEIVEQLNASAAVGRGITRDHFWVPDPASPEDYDARIAEAGGVDLFILATGATDGHVGFNPPGSPSSSRSRVVALSERTRRDNLHTFPSFGHDLDRVPRYGVTVGVATIRELSKRVVMVAHGRHKADAVKRLVAADGYEPDWPATVLVECAEPGLFIDSVAAASLTDTRAAAVHNR
ncbi:MAG: 6-phosphogluconolactonase [Actinobacteria bacterium]|nr:6-phosphogluconolactonase [Actinomycetota bacterium]MBO0834403.1 6-phosphogluconolactonase [Actinomycetota bacterium]